MPIGSPIKPRPIRPTFVLELAAESTEVSSTAGVSLNSKSKLIVQPCAKNAVTHLPANLEPNMGSGLENDLSDLGTIGKGKQSGHADRSAGCGAGNMILTLRAQGRSFRASRIAIFFVLGLFFQTHNILIRNFP